MLDRLTLQLLLGATLALLPAQVSAQNSKPGTDGQVKATTAKKPEKSSNPQVVLETNYGKIRIELFPKAAPQTVKNFLDLAAGRKEFTDPKTGKKVKRRFYDGLIFHRVIKNFMIQGGCPLGTGTGSPGYKFPDEINAKALGLDKIKVMPEKGHPNRWLGIRTKRDFQMKVVGPIVHAMGIKTPDEFKKRKKELQAKLESMSLMELYTDQGYKYNDELKSYKPTKGALAMANSGPNTNGSQFFINLVDTPWLTGRHTVFGKVVDGMDVVEKIGSVKVDARMKPEKPVTILSIKEVKPTD